MLKCSLGFLVHFTYSYIFLSVEDNRTVIESLKFLKLLTREGFIIIIALHYVPQLLIGTHT